MLRAEVLEGAPHLAGTFNKAREQELPRSSRGAKSSAPGSRLSRLLGQFRYSDLAAKDADLKRLTTRNDAIRTRDSLGAANAEPALPGPSQLPRGTRLLRRVRLPDGQAPSPESPSQGWRSWAGGLRQQSLAIARCTTEVTIATYVRLTPLGAAQPASCRCHVRPVPSSSSPNAAGEDLHDPSTHCGLEHRRRRDAAVSQLIGRTHRGNARFPSCAELPGPHIAVAGVVLVGVCGSGWRLRCSSASTMPPR